MIGAGIFAAPGPAAEAAGSLLFIGLALAGIVAYANATSSAQLAAVYPEYVELIWSADSSIGLVSMVIAERLIATPTVPHVAPPPAGISSGVVE